MSRYWIGVASRDHVQRGLAQGFCQLGHGRPGSLNRMKQGDWLIYYSGKEPLGSAELCQQFTAIGTIADDQAEQVEMAPDFHPWRRRVDYLPAHEVAIHDLLQDLDFIKDKKHWGAPFRFGFLEIQEADFLKIKQAMTVQP